jgi:hypothetical protein
MPLLRPKSTESGRALVRPEAFRDRETVTNLSILFTRLDRRPNDPEQSLQCWRRMSAHARVNQSEFGSEGD